MSIMFVCLYVCMYLCLYTCMYVSNVCMYICLYVYMYVCIFVCMNICIHEYVFECMYVIMHESIYIHTENKNLALARPCRAAQLYGIFINDLNWIEVLHYLSIYKRLFNFISIDTSEDS